MIHIVFGVPQRVRRDARNEYWIYGEEGTANALTFHFRRKSYASTEMRSSFNAASNSVQFGTEGSATGETGGSEAIDHVGRSPRTFAPMHRRPSERTFLFGIHPVLEALEERKPLQRVLFLKGKQTDELSTILRECRLGHPRASCSQRATGSHHPQKSPRRGGVHLSHRVSAPR